MVTTFGNDASNPEYVSLLMIVCDLPKINMRAFDWLLIDSKIRLSFTQCWLSDDVYLIKLFLSIIRPITLH